MNYKIKTTRRFEKSLKKCVKRGLPLAELNNVLQILKESGTLPEKYRQHKLSARWNYAWECHIRPDWLLIWEQNDTELLLLLVETGTHSDIFK